MSFTTAPTASGWRGKTAFDAIVLDIMLSGANGYQVCRTLRNEGNWTPILMLTAKDGIADEVEGLDTGADDYLSKPFSYAVLVARLRALLRRGARPRPTVLEVGDLRLDPAAHRVWRSGVDIMCNRARVRRPRVLRASPRRGAGEEGHALTRLGLRFRRRPDIIEVYVRRLRAKLQRSAGRPVIETIRGAGYRAVESIVLRRLRTIRAGTTAAATIIVGIALVAGAAALIAALRHSLTDEVEEAGRAQAIKISRQLETGRPTVLDVTGR